ncbi:response regulator transcription factor [Cyanobium sp. HWJ4-Hawea]|uniref:response regulator transcription factor RpaB n=1 Tax=Cyanobium sp. HWJ4-Hawea TaxID=2823713 RepID=UPI0020CBCB2D|nr:response regulator transcription factor [Cyanobium sp. HWJ4-Hawea]MCP9808725.1 response regulator transcription factor [Cyanobium sp. HWJ4-Hawea]
MTGSNPSTNSANIAATTGQEVARRDTILLVDDDANIRRVLETRLSMFGYDVATASDGEEALALFQTVEPDLVVLDVMMPKMDGYAVLKALRLDSDVPVVMLTACSEVKDRILGLELGADDYVIKPFSPKELEARIRCVLRRSGGSAQASPNSTTNREITVGELRVIPHKRQVFKSGERVRLTGMEFDLLEMLISRSGEPLTRQDMLTKIWGYTPERHSDTRVVDVHISRLRNKIEDDPENPELVITARGTGYLFQRLPSSNAG